MNISRYCENDNAVSRHSEAALDKHNERAVSTCNYWSGSLRGQLMAMSMLEGYSSMLSDKRKLKDGYLMQGVVDDIVGIISKYQTLVARRPCDGSMGKTPLEMVLIANAPLRKVKAVAEMVAKQKGSRSFWTATGWRGSLPIHLACRFGRSSVIDYVASALPAALATADREGKLPIDLVLERRAAWEGPSLPTIKRMLRLCPDSIALNDAWEEEKKKGTSITFHDDDGSWDHIQASTEAAGTAIQRLLFRNDHELEILKLMVHSFPGKRQSLHLIPQSSDDNLLMDKEHAMELAKLVWKVQDLRLEPNAWTRGAFCHFMLHVGNAPFSLRKLSMGLPAYSLSLPGSETRDALRSALERNLYLTEVCLDVCPDDVNCDSRVTYTDAPLIDSLCKGLETRQEPLNKLEISNFVLPNTYGLLRLMSGKASPKLLVLKSLEICRSNSRSIPVVQPSKDSGLETVQLLRGSVRSGSSYMKLCAGLSHYGGPWNLLLDPTFSGDLTNEVVKFLKHSPSLRSLDTGGSRLHYRRVLEALRQNSSLERLRFGGTRRLSVDEELVSLLEGQNTIEDISPIIPSRNDELQAKFEYLLYLNKCGRGLLRDPYCQLRTLVDLLSKLPHSGDVWLHYGLLIERPGLWS